MGFKNKILKKNVQTIDDLYSVDEIIDVSNKHKSIHGDCDFDFNSWLYKNKTQKIIKMIDELGQVPYIEKGGETWLNIRLLANLVVSIEPQIPPSYISWMIRQIRINDKKELHDMTNEIAKFYDVPFSNYLDFIERVKLAMAFRCGIDSWDCMDDTNMAKALTLCRRIEVNIRAIMDVGVAVKLVIGDIYKLVPHNQENNSTGAW